MIRTVKTNEDKRAFNRVWKKVFNNCGYQLEYARGETERYLLSIEDANIGALEFSVNYDIGGDVNKAFEFSRHELLKGQLENVAVVEKIVILPEFCGNHFLTEFFQAFEDFYQKHGKRYMVALIEPRFKRALAISYGVKVTKAGEKFHYKGDDVYPVIVDLKELVEKQHCWANKEETSSVS